MLEKSSPDYTLMMSRQRDDTAELMAIGVDSTTAAATSVPIVIIDARNMLGWRLRIISRHAADASIVVIAFADRGNVTIMMIV